MSQAEFKMSMDMLLATKLMQQVGGQQLIVDLLCEQIGMDDPLEVEDKNNISRLFMVTDTALPLFSVSLDFAAPYEV